VDGDAAPALRGSLLFQLSYHGFERVVSDAARPAGWDRARGALAARAAPLDAALFEPVFASRNQIVRVFRVRGADEPAPAPGAGAGAGAGATGGVDADLLKALGDAGGGDDEF